MKDYYQILGIKPNASDSEIKSAYKKLALKFHPDKNNGDIFFESLFKDIQEAYECLSNSESRKIYDQGSNNFFKKKQQSTTHTSEPIKEDKPLKKQTNSIYWIFAVIIILVLFEVASISNNHYDKIDTNSIPLEEIPAAVEIDCVDTNNNSTQEVNKYSLIVDSMKQVQNIPVSNVDKNQYEEIEISQDDKEIISFLKEYYKFYNRDHIFRNPIVKKTDDYNYDVSIEECISKDNFKNDEFFWHAKVIQISRQENGDLKIGRRFY